MTQEQCDTCRNIDMLSSGRTCKEEATEKYLKNPDVVCEDFQERLS